LYHTGRELAGNFFVKEPDDSSERTHALTSQTDREEFQHRKIGSFGNTY